MTRAASPRRAGSTEFAAWPIQWRRPRGGAGPDRGRPRPCRCARRRRRRPASRPRARPPRPPRPGRRRRTRDERPEVEVAQGEDGERGAGHGDQRDDQPPARGGVASACGSDHRPLRAADAPDEGRVRAAVRLIRGPRWRFALRGGRAASGCLDPRRTKTGHGRGGDRHARSYLDLVPGHSSDKESRHAEGSPPLPDHSKARAARRPARRPHRGHGDRGTGAGRRSRTPASPSPTPPARPRCSPTPASTPPWSRPSST